MAICETCDYANRPPYKSPCSECDKTSGSPFCCYEHEEKPTNADRIRAMTDEEMVEWAHKQIGCGFEFFPCGIVCEGKCEAYSKEACDAKILKWLQQPAEGDA